MNIVDTLRGMATALDSLFVWQFLIIGLPCLGLVLGALVVEGLKPQQAAGAREDRPYDWQTDGL